MKDRRTRQRVLAAATRQFSAHGFKHVTVRAICKEARANVAAVNYHFGDKLALYREVLEQAVAIVEETIDVAIAAGAGEPARGRLAAYVRVHCERMFAVDGPSVLQQLIQRELQEPTELMESLFDRIWRRRFDYLTAVVAEIVGLDRGDAAIARCVMSLHGQILAFRPNPMTARRPDMERAVFQLDPVVDHITRFTLAGCQAYGTAPPPEA